MAVTRVNSSSISGTSATAAAYTTTFGVALSVGDLIVVTMNSNGTHATNGMACSDAVNGTYSTGLETQLGNASSKWQQSFYKVVTATTGSTTVITGTPYAAATATTFVVDVFRGTSGSISQAFVGASNASAATATSPALGAAPAAGDLVLSLASIGISTMTKPTAFTAGSAQTVNNVAAENAYVLSADGSSTYSGTWTWGTAGNAATQTVAFGQAASAPALPIIVLPPRR